MPAAVTAGAKREAVSLPGPNGAGAGRMVTVGGMRFSSSITALDPETGVLSESAVQQVAAAFANFDDLLARAGADREEIGHVNVAMPEGGPLQEFERAWSRRFPEAEAAPVRKVNTYPLPEGQWVQIQAVGVKGGRRGSVSIPGFAGPSPRGVRLGDVVFSGEIDGRDPATGRRSEDRRLEMRQAFDNMEAFIGAAGGAKEDLIHVFIFVRGREDQADMLDAWLEAFPEDGNRPARKAIFDPTLEREGKRILLLCTAVLGKTRRVNLEVPGISKRHPNPMGCRLGNLVFSSGVGGDDPSGRETGQDPGRRAALAFANMEALLGQAGGSLEDIGMVSITVNGYGDEAAILGAWDAVFPDAASAPARHVMAFGGRGSYPVQLHIVAALSQG